MRRATMSRLIRLEGGAGGAADAGDGMAAGRGAPDLMTSAELWAIVCHDARAYLLGEGGRLAIKGGLSRYDLDPRRAWLEELIAATDAHMAGGAAPVFLTSHEAGQTLAWLDGGRLQPVKDPTRGAAGDPATWPEVGFQWHYFDSGRANVTPAGRRWLFLGAGAADEEDAVECAHVCHAVAESIQLFDDLTRRRSFPPVPYLTREALRGFLQRAWAEARQNELYDLEAVTP